MSEHTCASGQRSGTAITLYIDRTRVKQMSDHDWHNCEACREDYNFKRGQYLGDLQKKSDLLTVTTFATVADWTTTRKRWDKRHERGGQLTSGIPFHQANGTVIVAHNNTMEPGQEIADIAAAVTDWTDKPSTDHRNRAFNVIDSKWTGTRGDGRTKDKEDSWQLKTSANVHLVAKRMLGVEIEYRAKGNVGTTHQIHCTDSYVNLRDWLHDELQNGTYYSLDEKYPHNADNEVIQAIINDPLCLEVMRQYGPHEPLKASAKPTRQYQLIEEKQLILPLVEGVTVAANVHRGEVMDDSGDILQVAELQSSYFEAVFSSQSPSNRYKRRQL